MIISLSHTHTHTLKNNRILMSVEKENISKKKNSKKSVGGSSLQFNGDELVTWKQKKTHADKEEQVIGKEVEELITWTSLIEAMNDQQLKDYVLNRPENLQSVKIGKAAAPTKRRSSGNKSKCSSSSNNGLMDVIWKFHREDQDDQETNSTASVVT